MKLHSVTYDPTEISVAIAKLQSFLNEYSGRRQAFLLIGPFGAGRCPRGLGWQVECCGQDDLADFRQDLIEAIDAAKPEGVAEERIRVVVK